LLDLLKIGGKIEILDEITKDGKAIYLAYDHGLEHGPTDFNDKSVDPKYILDIALKGKFNGIVLHKGITEKYYTEKYRKVPLILKLNGKTNIVKGEPVSSIICTIEEAIELGAKAVGYTIYIGSEHEEEMIKEFSRIEHIAHHLNLPVIAWMYPRRNYNIYFEFFCHTFTNFCKF